MSQESDMEEDLESQSSKSTSSTEKVWVSMPKAKKATWKEAVGTKPICIEGPFHAHPLLAASRFVLEAEACRLAVAALREYHGGDVPENSKVCDIGGAPKRTSQHLGSVGHFMLPDLQPGDRTRFNECPKQYRAQVCRCRFEHCDHLYKEDGLLREPTAFVSIHSAYYLDRAVLWRRLRDSLMVGFFAVGHHFDEPFGGFDDEAIWEQHGSSITMRVKGQVHSPYRHDILPWTLDWRGPNGEAFECEAKRSILGFTTLWEVRAVMKDSGLTPATFNEVKSNPRFWGPLQFSSAQRGAVVNDSRISMLNVDLDCVEKIGGILYTTSTPIGGEPVHVSIPVTLVSKAASRAVNHERDPRLLSDITHMLKHEVETSRVPVASQPLVLIMAAAMGMVIHLGAEVDVQYTTQSRFSWLFSIHKSLLHFQQPAVWKCWKLFFCAMFCLCPPLVVTLVQHDWELDLASWLTGVAMLVVGVCVARVAIVVSREINRYSTARWRRGYDRGYASHNPMFSTPSVLERLLPGSTNVRDPTDVTDVTRIVLNRDSRDPRAEPIVRAHIAGLVADTATVNVTEPTQESELSAVTHRLGRPKPEMRWETMSEVRSVLGEPEFEALCRTYSIDNSPVAFFKWLNNQSEKYPTAVIESWRVLYQTADRALVKRKGKPFQKIELNGKPVVLEGQAPVKPRLIQPPSDEAKVVTGPAAAQMYKRCVKIWDGIKNPILYASGRTTDFIGGVFDRWLDHFGGESEVVGLTFDCSDYDSTLKHPQQFIIAELYRKMGCDLNVIGWFFETLAQGNTVHGVAYDMDVVYRITREQDALWFERWLDLVDWPYSREIDIDELGNVSYVYTMKDFMMNSGRMDTNLMDTLFNAAAFFSYCRKTGVDVRMMVCGDDNFTLMRRSDCTNDWFEGLERHLRDCGLDAKGSRSIRRSDWEFCSKLFWYALDKTTKTSQTVLAAKPGRSLSRIGITVSVPNQANIAATAQGLKQDANHVPFVRVMAKRTYELCVQEKIKAKGVSWEGLRAGKAYDLDPRNFVITYERYGLTDRDESEFTSVLQGCTTLPMFYHWGPVARMALRDAE